jgi:hypothetical protein
MNSTASIALDCVLRVMRPLARLLIKNGVSYPAFAQALKGVFLAAAQDELKSRAMPQTDSAVSLLSGVHRRDVRTMTRLAPAQAMAVQAPLSLVAQVVARWLSDAAFCDEQGRARLLPRSSNAGSFDQLVAQISSDVRPRAVLDELQRLGAVAEEPDGVRLLAGGFAPRQGLEEMAWLFSDNLHDHLAAACLNLQGEANFLEQSIFVDELTPASAERLHKVSQQAWAQAFKTVMQEAQARFDDDALHAKAEDRTRRARFGAYFYAERQGD